MLITDVAGATAWLSRIGYYRLSGYWYPFRKSHISVNPITGELLRDPVTKKSQVIVEDHFREDTTFQLVMDLYVFDKRLRLLFLDAIERIEIALRVEIALLLGARDPLAHRDPNQLRGSFSKRLNGHNGMTDHQEWLARLDDTFRRSKEEFVKHFKQKYPGGPAPIWISIELWDFGMLSKLLSGLKYEDQNRLAMKYGLPRPDLLTSWVRNLNHIRNICAHHSRLWNRSPADQGSPPRPGEVPLLDHLISDRRAMSRIYATAVVLQFLLKTTNPTTSWGERLKSHVATFPGSPQISMAQAGFPKRWEELPLWN